VYFVIKYEKTRTNLYKYDRKKIYIYCIKNMIEKIDIYNEYDRKKNKNK